MRNLHKTFKKYKKKISSYRLLLVIFFIIFFSGCIISGFYTIRNHNRVQSFNVAFSELQRNNPTPYQEFFLNDLQNNRNDLYTKSSAYFIMHRYFDNGGNVYELYDYVEKNNTLAFLKQAENIYPTIFEQVKNKEIPFTYSDQGMYVYLAYLEILERYKYSDISMSGSLAGQYAKMAYYKKMILKDKAKGISLEYPDYTDEEAQNDVKKSLFFIEKSKNEINNLVSGGSTKNIFPTDLLIGATQYAIALRYLEGIDVHYVSPKTSEAIFSFSMKYANSFVKDQYFYTSLLNASTLILVSNNYTFELRNAIYPFFSIMRKIENPSGVVRKVLDSRFESKVSRFKDLDPYSRMNVKIIALRVPEFKKWLLLNNWQELDFR